MGKVAGAAVLAVAPEAEPLAAAAGKGKGGKPRKAPVPDPRVTHPGSEAARQRQAVEDVKAARKPQPDEHDDQADEHDEHQADEQVPGFPGISAPATGGGFVLGVIGWALLRAWIGGQGRPSGADGVKALLRAKFLNKTTP